MFFQSYRYTAQHVIQGLQTEQLDDSCVENEAQLHDYEFIPNCFAGIENFESNTDSGEAEQALLMFR